MTAPDWTFDSGDRPPVRNRNVIGHRTPKHHPNLDGLDHRFGPDLECEWCGIRYELVIGQAEADRLPCPVGNPHPNRYRG